MTRGRGGYYQGRQQSRNAGLPHGDQRDQFVMANYKLSVKPSVPEREWGFDEIPRWEDICEACIQSDEEFACPICFEHPSAARVTSCGHYFCLPCVLPSLRTTVNGERCLDLDTPVRCPICTQDMKYSELKPLTNLPTRNVLTSQGAFLYFTLVQRAQDKTTCRPVGSQDLVDPRFNRCVSASEESYFAICQRELSELQEVGYRTAASAGTRVGGILAEAGPASAIAAALKIVQGEARARQPDPNAKKVAGRSSRAKPEAPTSRTLSFYQVSDGRPIFVHPTQAALLHSLGEQVRLPITRLIKYQQSLGTRQLHPMCAHLPLRADYFIAVVDGERLRESGVEVPDLPAVDEEAVPEVKVEATKRVPQAQGGKKGSRNAQQRNQRGGSGRRAQPSDPATMLAEEVFASLTGDMGIDAASVTAAIAPLTLRDVAAAQGSPDAVVDYILQRI